MGQNYLKFTLFGNIYRAIKSIQDTRINYKSAFLLPFSNCNMNGYLVTISLEEFKSKTESLFCSRKLI